MMCAWRSMGAFKPSDPTILGDQAPASLRDLAPTVLAGRYEILGLLGTGGMGRVYRAADRELGETVALKVLHRDFVDSAEMVERFRQEVRLARRVTHRNVARTFDIGEHEGEKFLTMELIVGEPLTARLARGLLPIFRSTPRGRLGPRSFIDRSSRSIRGRRRSRW